MTLIEIMDMWKNDCIINQLNLKDSALGVPKLHAKYLDLFMRNKLQMRKIDSDFLNLKRDKRNWYFGVLPEEDLNARGWLPCQINNPLKSEVDRYLTEDSDMIKMQDRYEYFNMIANALESILKTVQYRGQNIKTVFEIHKFENGG